MSVFIHSIATANPKYAYNQDQVREFIKKQYPDGSMAQRVVHKVYSSSGIQNRYSVIPDVLEPSTDTPFFRHDGDSALQLPGTKFRNDWYIKESRALFTTVCGQALENSSFSKQDVTHVITVSCTGFYAPGPDFYIVKDLGLNESVQRFHIGFMGCYAAFTAFRMAKTICESNPNAVVLIGDLELCSIHLQFNENTDSIVSGSVFADGAAGVVISSKEKTQNGIEILGLETAITEKGESDMAWTIGDNGFDMVLSAYVPRIIGSELDKVIFPWLKKYQIDPKQVKNWAIHPGGMAVLKKSEQALGISSDKLQASYSILRQYGNMSSVTILFILQELLASNHKEIIPAMAFGPGLTVEFGIFRFI